MYVEKVGLAKPLSAFGDELVKYIVREVEITVPFMGSYKYYFGKFYKDHPRFTEVADKTLYMNDYEKIYDVPVVLDKLRLVYPFYDIFYDDINGVIHVRVRA
jgi:hypothetical protein